MCRVKNTQVKARSAPNLLKVRVMLGSGQGPSVSVSVIITFISFDYFEQQLRIFFILGFISLKKKNLWLLGNILKLTKQHLPPQILICLSTIYLFFLPYNHSFFSVFGNIFNHRSHFSPILCNVYTLGQRPHTHSPLPGMTGFNT